MNEFLGIKWNSNATEWWLFFPLHGYHFPAVVHHFWDFTTYIVNHEMWKLPGSPSSTKILLFHPPIHPVSNSIWAYFQFHRAMEAMAQSVG